MNYHLKEIIEEVCAELKINVTSLSNGYVLELEKGKKREYIVGNYFPLNSISSHLIASDRYATYEVLKNKSIPVVEHFIIYPWTNLESYALGCNQYEDYFTYFRNNKKHIVVKTNKKMSKNDVFEIKTKNELIRVIDLLFQNNSSISLCPFYEIEKEYRIIILNGRVMYVYGKKRPVLIGDGVSTVKELLLKFNSLYYKKENFEKNLDYDLYYVLGSGEKIIYNWKFDLSSGSIVFDDIELKIAKRLIDIAKNVQSALNFSFCSVDIIETSEEEFLVLGVNSAVVLKYFSKYVDNGREISKTIYRKAIEDLFRIKK